jgi:hypothetical protein
MAIIKELFMTRNDGVNLYRTYSDEGKQVLQVETGIVYGEAIDVEGAPYTYVEYEEPIEPEFSDDPEDTNPEIEEGEDESTIMTRAELTAKVTALEEQNAMLMECLLEMSGIVYA